MAFTHGHLAGLCAPAAECLAEHFAEINHADLTAGHAGHVEIGHGALIGHVDFDFLVVEFPLTQFATETLARRLGRAFTNQSLQHAGLGAEMGFGLNVFALSLAHLRNADFYEIADDLFYIPADIADLGEFGRFDLNEGGFR